MMSPFIQLRNVPSAEPMEGFSGKFVHSEYMTIARWIIRSGSILPAHSHLHEQVAEVLSGEFELTIDGVTQVLTPGIVAVIPPNAVHSGRAITDCEIIDVFFPVREDYRSADTHT
jgi:quercetin dioxygenase-like cupin family protein